MGEVQVWEGDGPQTIADRLHDAVEQTKIMLQVMERHGFQRNDWIEECLRKDMEDKKITAIYESVRAIYIFARVGLRGKPKTEPRRTIELVEKLWRKIKFDHIKAMRT